jgi:TPP-dependent trihydroxycyclohexane-1,2-dione (THcHDO) dehydratase
MIKLTAAQALGHFLAAQHVERDGGEHWCMPRPAVRG